MTGLECLKSEDYPDSLEWLVDTLKNKKAISSRMCDK